MNDAKWKTGPRCGAKRKRDGQPCEAPALANGRCYFHGGRVPKGKQWHVRQFPDGRSPVCEQKLARRIEDRRLTDHRRRLRKAAMTPEERAAHEAWHKAHKSGSASKRNNARKQRGAAADLARLMNEPPAPASREEQEITAALETLRAELERREALYKLELFS